MKIVTDSGADLSFEDCQKIGVSMLPLKVEVNGKSYQSGIDITPDEFYDLMDASPVMPVTSTPSVGEFEALYRRLAADDPQILSIHLSSGLSGTYNAAVQGASLVKEADITVIDTLTLSAGTAWQVLAAAEMAKASTPKDVILRKLRQIQDATHALFTLPELKYLIAGGRISHLKGLLASLLGIKPVIEVSQEDGKYYDKSKKRSFQKALASIPELMAHSVPAQSALRAQIVSAGNPQGAEALRAEVNQMFTVEWLPVVSLGTALGAHTGRGMVGVVFAARDALPIMP